MSETNSNRNRRSVAAVGYVHRSTKQSGRALAISARRTVWPVRDLRQLGHLIPVGFES
jgi:hypothetical protein